MPHRIYAPDAVIQLICRWASADSLKVYRQMGIEKNVFWTNKAASVTFDATRMNDLPALDAADCMREQIQAFERDVEPASTPRQAPSAPRSLPSAPRATRTFTVPGGHVSAHPSDREGLVGLCVGVPASFWSAADQVPGGPARYECVVAAECAREFRHPDGTLHALSHLLAGVECAVLSHQARRAAQRLPHGGPASRAASCSGAVGCAPLTCSRCSSPPFPTRRTLLNLSTLSAFSIRACRSKH